jgi:hypothetical protein
MDDLRLAHQHYLFSAKLISFGGLCFNAAKAPKKIVYVISGENLEEIEQFIKNDPYYPLYLQYEVETFIQKIPR